MKKISNLIIGSLVFTTGVALYSIVKEKRRQAQELKEFEEKYLIHKEEEKRNYIDLSEQLKETKKETKEIKEKVLSKEYTA